MAKARIKRAKKQKRSRGDGGPPLDPSELPPDRHRPGAKKKEHERRYRNLDEPYDRRPKFGDASKASFGARLREALNRWERHHNVDFFEEVIARARTSDSLAASLLQKFVPNKTQLSVGPEDLNSLLVAMTGLIGQHVKDPAALQAIAAGLKKLAQEEE